jgi:hypothetical protein
VLLEDSVSSVWVMMRRLRYGSEHEWLGGNNCEWCGFVLFQRPYVLYLGEAEEIHETFSEYTTKIQIIYLRVTYLERYRNTKRIGEKRSEQCTVIIRILAQDVPLTASQINN